jgi:hypothetical protein
MARNFVYYRKRTYSGGQNDAADLDQLRDDESRVVQNAYIGKEGIVQKRSGTTILGDDTGDTKITGLDSWKESDGTKWLFSTTGTDLRYLNSTTWDTLDNGFTTGLDTEFVVADNKLYILNGTDNMHSYDGASVALNSGLVDMGNAAVPKAKYGVWWKNYMFICGASVFDGTSYPTRVWFSNIGDADTWTTATDYFDVGLDDGQAITGIGILDKFLVIFKENSIYILTGDGPSAWKLSATVNNLVTIANGVGCASHRSIVQVSNDLWFMDQNGNIRSIRKNEEGGNPLYGIISANIQGTIDGLNKGSLSKVAGKLFNNRVYYAAPNGSSSFNNILMVADLRIRIDKPLNPHPWVTYTGWSPGVLAVYLPSNQPQLYYGEGDADSLIYQAETGTNDNSAAIDFDIKDRMIDLRDPDMRKTARFIIVTAESGGDYNVAVSSSLDGTTFSEHGNINLYSGDVWNSGTWDTSTWGYGVEIKKKFALQRASEQIMIRFRNNAADQAVTMKPYTLAFKPKKIK